MSSRDRILARVRAAVADAPAAPALTRAYLTRHTPDDPAAVLDLLHENLADYRAVVHRTDAAGVGALITELLTARGSGSVLVPAGLPQEWLSHPTPVRVDDTQDSTAAELDAVDSVVTGC